MSDGSNRQMMSEAELVAGLKAGKTEAQHEMFARYRDPLYRAAAQMGSLTTANSVRSPITIAALACGK